MFVWLIWPLLVRISSDQLSSRAYTAAVGSRKVNGVAELHSDLLKKTIMKDMVDVYGPSK